ncbi:MAG: DUF5060 domain-containing protein [Acidobacteria bacterium]|nr:MAG: DUF5060 domain-containing protein [Acidobacteriota bacterium]
MRIRSFVLGVICLFSLHLALLGQPGASEQQSVQRVERWDTAQFSFVSARALANPFRDLSLQATFSHADGRQITVSGFYDGGATWRIRFMPLEIGRWDYTTKSNDPALDGKRGAIDCIAPQKSYLHGPLHSEGLHFRHADGTRRFLISTRLSCQSAPASVWDKVIPFLQKNRINRVLFMMVGIHGQAKGLYGQGGADLWSYNVEKFQAIDGFIDALRRADIVVSPYFYYFNDRFQRKLTPEQDEAFLRYGMARFGAYANVMPVLANEVEQKFSERAQAKYDPRDHQWANRFGKLLEELAVFKVPIAVHNPMESFEARNPGFFTLLQDWPFPWADFMLRQMQVGALGSAPALADDVPEPTDPTWNARAFARHNDLLLRLRRFNVPIINEEPGYEMEGTRSWNGQTSPTVRATFWTAAMAGAYTMWGNPATYELGDPVPYMERSRTPSDLRLMGDVMDRVPYWEMEPHNELINANMVEVCGEEYRRNFLLARTGRHYLVYSRDGGTIEMTTDPGEYELESILLNDVPAAYTIVRPKGRLTAKDGKVSFFLSAAMDWVAILRKVE